MVIGNHLRFGKLCNLHEETHPPISGCDGAHGRVRDAAHRRVRSDRRQNLYLLAISLAAISVLAVRLINRLLFDVLFVRRSGREAPALLRGLLSIALYIAAFLLIYRTVLDREIGLEILATSTVLSVILGLAL